MQLQQTMNPSRRVQEEECQRVFGSRRSWGHGGRLCEAFEGFTMSEIVAKAAAFPWYARRSNALWLSSPQHALQAGLLCC